MASVKTRKKFLRKSVNPRKKSRKKLKKSVKLRKRSRKLKIIYDGGKSEEKLKQRLKDKNIIIYSSDNIIEKFTVGTEDDKILYFYEKLLKLFATDLKINKIVVLANLNLTSFGIIKYDNIVKFIVMTEDILTPFTKDFGAGDKPEEKTENTIAFNSISFTSDTVKANALLTKTTSKDYIEKTKSYVQKELDEKLNFFKDEEFKDMIKKQNNNIIKEINEKINDSPLNIPLGGFNWKLLHSSNVIEITFFNRGVLPKGSGHQLLAYFLLYYNEYNDTKIDTVVLSAVNPKPYYKMGFKFEKDKDYNKMSANVSDIIESCISRTDLTRGDIYIKNLIKK